MNDQPKKTAKKKDESAPGPKRRLLRSKADRMITGVAGGIAEHIGLNSTLVRAGFVVVTLLSGGLGLLAYLILAVALPENDGTGQPVDEPVSARLGRVLLVSLLVVAVICLAFCLAVASAWVTATGHGTIVAGVVIAVGVALVAAAFVEGVRRRVLPWLVGAGLLLAIPAGAVAAADVHIDASMGEREYRPAAVADIPEDGYELGMGKLIVDLRDLPWAKGEAIPVSAELGMGQMIVSVPSNVCVVADAEAKAGELLVAGETSDGLNPDVDGSEPQSAAPRLDLDAELQFGQLVVTDRDPDEVDNHGPGPRGHGYDNEDNEEVAETQRQVCGR
jgi:phage shock protein PspC (stress-responsive transcriptional regulator)